jgi:hypothetical protein
MSGTAVAIRVDQQVSERILVERTFATGETEDEPTDHYTR